MPRPILYALYAGAFLALPAGAAIVGVRTLRDRDHPPLPSALDVEAVERIPRPAIDPTRSTAVVLLGADLTEITDALGPYEMFARVGRFNVITAAAERQPSMLTGGLRILPHYALSELDTLLDASRTIVVIPNLPNARERVNRPVIEWIQQQASHGALIHSWCKGAMALAETGLLDGHTATAHWGDIPTLEKLYPRVRWVRGVRWIDRGQFVMSAGITSGMDASLRVIIRLAGDSVARRVAQEMRYPDYHFAIDPAVEQYALQPSDLVLLVNAAYRFFRPTIGVALYDGVGEMDLSNVFDAHGHTMIANLETVAEREAPVITARGLTLFPSVALSTSTVQGVRGLHRLMVPGVDARGGATSLLAGIEKAAPSLRAEFLHADEPLRFGLEPVLEDLSRTADAPTARFAQRRMEYRSTAVRLAGSKVPWVPMISAATLAALGLRVALMLRLRYS